jgi:pilus assembly protein Flp/PilA
MPVLKDLSSDPKWHAGCSSTPYPTCPAGAETQPTRTAHPSNEWSPLAMPAFQLLSHLKNRLLNEEAQDLVEYALVVAILSFSAVATMQSLSVGIANAFAQLAVTFNSYV